MRHRAIFMIGVFFALELGFMYAQSTLQALDQFESYDIVRLDPNALLTQKFISAETYRIDLPISGKSRTLILTKRNMFGQNYQVKVAAENGDYIADDPRPIPTRGYVLGHQDSRTAITMNKDFIYGRVEFDGETYYIEPLNYYQKEAAKDQFLVYNVKDVNDTKPHTCGVTEAHKLHSNVKDQVDAQNRSAMMDCWEVEWAIANDWLMFQSYGSANGVENHAIGVANDVQTNWDNEFPDEVQFFISEQFVSSCSSCDPWTSSNEAGTLLNSFTNWGDTGFTFDHDIGSLWTNRNFNGSTIGIAWVGVVCQNSRYNCLEDFSNNANLKRVMVAHEIGHNFDAVHDSGSNFIMSPSVNNSNTWSNNSINDIQSHINSRWCLGTCVGTGSAPVPDFDISYISECVPGEVQFNDISSNTPDTWFWEFEGGTPSTSNQQNPNVLYGSGGLYNVTLTVSNSWGNNTSVYIDAVEILLQPEADFITTINGLTVQFDNISSNSSDFFWTFGDGNFSSNDNPVHTYTAAGTYNVILTAFNGTCQDVLTIPVTVSTAPTAQFTSNVTSGCTPLNVSYNASSSIGATSYLWTFEGGSPATSTSVTPQVIYNTPGTFDTRLIVTNAGGIKDTLDLLDYMTVNTVPTAGFTSLLTGLTASFTNTSSNFTSLSWSFGDGSTSTMPNPSHTYSQPGDYTVVLTAASPCGTDTHTFDLDVEVAPTASFTTNVPLGQVLCATANIDFEAGQQNNLDSYSWVFEGGNPATSTEANPSVTYSTAGNFDVTLIVTNNIGSDTIFSSNVINVEDIPVASFISAVNQLSVDFTNTTLNGVNFQWSFGDGGQSNQTSPQHTYASPGVYAVTLTASNTCGDATIVQNVSVQSVPVSGFTANDTEICPGDQVAFVQNASANATSYSWIFEGGSPGTSSQQNPIVTYASAGSYDVTLIVSNNVGSDTLTLSDYITVSDTPNAAVSATVNDNVITIIDQSTGGNSATYTVNGVAHTGTNFTAPANGTYTIVLTSVNDCGSDQASTTVNVSAFASAAFSVSNTSDCGPVQVIFNNMSSMATSYSWTFDGGMPSTSTMPNPSVSYATSGTYDVTLVATNALGSSTITQQVTVTVIPLPSGSFTGSNNAATYTFVADENNATSYVWDFGDGASGSGKTATHAYTAEGNYTVTLVVTGPCGSATSTQMVEVEINLPSVSISTTGSNTGCAPFSVSFMDNSTNEPTAWSWSFPGGTPASASVADPTIEYDTPGVYPVTLTVTNAFGQSTQTFDNYVTVLDTPTAGFNSTVTQGDVTFDFTGSGATSYLWDFGDGTTSTDQNPTHTYKLGGRYTVTLIVTNACGSTTTQDEVVIVLSSVRETLLDDLTLRPNPATRYIRIESGKVNSNDLGVVILDMQGKLISSALSAFSEPSGITITFDEIPQGTYLVRIQHIQGDVAYKKLIILP